MKIVGMIPARMGSTRVKNKNLRLINNKPLIQYIIDSASKSKFLKEVYVNSESKIFEESAHNNGVKFFLRSEKLASDSATNDECALDFIDLNFGILNILFPRPTRSDQ